ncbi:glycosyltransferase [Edwardsiella hoshinae]|uniref:Glycogen synthase n=1 Tax=Edwardsiella hoshinae TaxID=93378 RepID=A0A376DQ03_9GAMM|nr:glycosyltransferase [Edwardsiella hoshinae]QPR28771.1 glycosyltransferase [Edwardsiella hoshinae]STC92207.1 Glycogen synthase [Edwardsiella hoshinae]
MNNNSSMAYHIVHLIDLRNVGGVETMFCDFLRYATQAYPHMQHTLVMEHQDIAAALRPRLQGLPQVHLRPIKRYGRFNLPNRPKFFRAWNRLHIIHQSHPDVILIWNQFTEWHLSSAYTARYLASCPVVYYEHGMSWYQHTPSLPTRFFAQVTHCLAVSHACKRMLELKHHVSQPIDIEFNAPRQLPLSHATKPIRTVGQPIIFGSAGRLVPLKCLGLLLLTSQELQRRAIPHHCYIAGVGKEADYLARLRATLKVEKNTTLMGFVSNMDIFYKQLDLYLCPSMHETASLTALEAGTYGIPTITSNIDGLPETVRHQHTGLCLTPTLSVQQYADLCGASINFAPLVYDPLHDCLTPPQILSPQQLADSIEYLYHHPEVYQRLSEGAREHAAASRDFAALADALCQRLGALAQETTMLGTP